MCFNELRTVLRILVLFNYYYYYKDLFTHKDINTYINGVVKICLNKFFLKIQVSKRKEKKYAKLCTNRKK